MWCISDRIALSSFYRMSTRLKQIRDPERKFIRDCHLKYPRLIGLKDYSQALTVERCLSLFVLIRILLQAEKFAFHITGNAHYDEDPQGVRRVVANGDEWMNSRLMHEGVEQRVRVEVSIDNAIIGFHSCESLMPRGLVLPTSYADSITAVRTYRNKRNMLRWYSFQITGKQASLASSKRPPEMHLCTIEHAYISKLSSKYMKHNLRIIYLLCS